MLADLEGVVCLGAFEVSLYLDDGFPVRMLRVCEAQVLPFRLPRLYFCVHVSDRQPEIPQGSLRRP